MTIKELHAFLVDCCRRGVSADAEILIDAESEDEGVVRLEIVMAAIALAHDEEETPYVVLKAEAI